MKRAESGAVFSPDRAYRYLLWRRWSRSGGTVLFVGLNPSTADEASDDPTIRRCIGFARRCGAGSLLVANLFAWRATHVKDLLAAADPVGPDTHAWLAVARRAAACTIACWGRHGSYRERSAEVAGTLGAFRCLGTTSNGEPRHPLYLRRDAALIPFACSQSHSGGPRLERRRPARRLLRAGR